MNLDERLDRACGHQNNHASVEVVHLEDTGRRQAIIRIWCQDCDEPYHFPDSLPAGVDLSGITTDLEGQELRIAIRSAADVPEGL